MDRKITPQRVLRRYGTLVLLCVVGACAQSAESADGASKEDQSPDDVGHVLAGAGGGATGAKDPSLAGAGNEGAVNDVFEGEADILGGKPDEGAGGASATSCLNFMSWGRPGEFGAVPGEGDTDAIVSWMNEQSTAVGEHILEKPEVTPEFLEGVDLVLLQDLSLWEFDAIELDVFEAWVRAGGAVFTISGFRGDGQEVPPTNRLLSFSGMNYAGQSSYGDTSISLGECSYCMGSTHRQEGWNPEHPIAEGIDAVGAYQGRSILGDGEVVAKEDGKILAMSKEIEAGRVFFFHDDWVSYRSQWDGSMMDLCELNLECSGVSAQSNYQIPRFWLNTFRWLVPHAGCFEINGVR